MDVPVWLTFSICCPSAEEIADRLVQLDPEIEVAEALRLMNPSRGVALDQAGAIVVDDGGGARLGRQPHRNQTETTPILDKNRPIIGPVGAGRDARTSNVRRSYIES